MGGMKHLPSDLVNTINMHHNGERSPVFTLHFFTLEITCKYTQPCDIYRWGQTQYHHGSTHEWLLVGPDGGRVGQSLLSEKEICSDDFRVILLLFF